MKQAIKNIRAKTREIQLAVVEQLKQHTQTSLDRIDFTRTPHQQGIIVNDSTLRDQSQPDHNDPRKLCFEPFPSSYPPSTNGSSISICSVECLGDVHSNTTYVKRDLGFQGRIGQYILLSYGDTLYTDKNYSDTFRGIVSNSMAFATHDPTVVIDPVLDSNDYPCQLVPTNSSWNEDLTTHAVGITNVVETSSDTGVLFTLLNYRPTGKDNIMGAGIATIKLDISVYPPTYSTTRISQYIWDGDTEPWYGDVCALKTNDYIYAYGHKKNNPWVYLTRVPTKEVGKIECHEYWHGNDIGWSTNRLIGDDANETQSVFWQINQGQVFWSAYYNTYLFIYCDNFWSSTVLLRHSPNPEGPWSDAITVYKAIPVSKGGNVYAAVPHPYFDMTGRSLVITFTNYPNCIQAIKVTFD